MKFELLHHWALDGWCKVKDLEIRPNPSIEGSGGYMVREDQAHLIAAAPEMLSMLNYIDDQVDHLFIPEDDLIEISITGEAARQLIKLIAKARGETP